MQRGVTPIDGGTGAMNPRRAGAAFMVGREATTRSRRAERVGRVENELAVDGGTVVARSVSFLTVF